MRRLSISAAWDDTKAILARDGKLFVSVALALVAFPTLVTGILNPKGMGASSAPLWISLVGLVASLVALAGQLALIRLALGPSITVGKAIEHGMRRMPIYFAAAFLMVAAFILIAVPFGAILTGMGVSLSTNPVPMSPPVVLCGLIYLAIITFIGIRMSMSAAAASAESIGPVAVLRRSWDMTAGNFWRLFGFVILYFVAASVAVLGVSAATGTVVGLALGPVEPLSMSALVIALVRAVLNAVLTAVLAVMLARIYVQLAGRGETDSGLPITGI